MHESSNSRVPGSVTWGIGRLLVVTSSLIFRFKPLVETPLPLISKELSSVHTEACDGEPFPFAISRGAEFSKDDSELIDTERVEALSFSVESTMRISDKLLGEKYSVDKELPVRYLRSKTMFIC